MTGPGDRGYFFVSVGPLDSAAPVPPPACVPVPGLPPDATSPDAPPTMPVSVPFFESMSVAAFGGTTGASLEAGGGTLGAGIGAGAGAVAGGGAGRSLQATSSATSGDASHRQWRVVMGIVSDPRFSGGTTTPRQGKHGARGLARSRLRYADCRREASFDREKPMFRFLLGVVVGATAATMWIGPGAGLRQGRPAGRVDELSSAADNVVADPPLNAGDGTPNRAASTTGA